MSSRFQNRLFWMGGGGGEESSSPKIWLKMWESGQENHQEQRYLTPSLEYVIDIDQPFHDQFYYLGIWISI